MATHQDNEIQVPQQPDYRSGMTRRDSLKLMMALAASTLLPSVLAGCDSAPAPDKEAGASAAKATTEHWPELKLSPITSTGYGKDPNLIVPPVS